MSIKNLNAKTPIGEKIIEWDTSKIIESEIEYYKKEDEETRKEIATLYIIARKQVSELVDLHIQKGYQALKNGVKLNELFLNKDGSINEPLIRKCFRKSELKRLIDIANKRINDNLFNKVSECHFTFEEEYSSLTEYLTEVMESLPNYNGTWCATVINFGWRSLNGQKIFKAEDGQGLLQEILPKTDCTYTIFKTEDGKGLAIQNFHHDSPTGNEWYYIFPSQDEEE